MLLISKGLGKYVLCLKDLSYLIADPDPEDMHLKDSIPFFFFLTFTFCKLAQTNLEI